MADLFDLGPGLAFKHFTTQLKMEIFSEKDLLSNRNLQLYLCNLNYHIFKNINCLYQIFVIWTFNIRFLAVIFSWVIHCILKFSYFWCKISIKSIFSLATLHIGYSFCRQQQNFKILKMFYWSQMLTTDLSENFHDRTSGKSVRRNVLINLTLQK